MGSTCSSIDFNRNGQIVATCEKGACIIDTRYGGYFLIETYNSSTLLYYNDDCRTGFGETRISKKRYLTSVKWSIPSRKLLYATDNNQSILMFDIRMLKRPALETKLNHSVDSFVRLSVNFLYATCNSGIAYPFFSRWSILIREYTNEGNSR